MTQTLIATLHEAAYLLEAAGFDQLADEYALPAQPLTRDPLEVIDAIRVVESELGHHVERLLSASAQKVDPASARTMLDLAAQYTASERVLGILRRYLTKRMTSAGRIAAEVDA